MHNIVCNYLKTLLLLIVCHRTPWSTLYVYGLYADSCRHALVLLLVNIVIFIDSEK